MIKEATIDDLKQVVDIVMKYREFYGVDKQRIEDIEAYINNLTIDNIIVIVDILKNVSQDMF